MLKVISVQDKSAQETLCRVCGVDFDSASMAYAAYDDENGEDALRGIVQFSFFDKAGHIISLSSPKGTEDFGALFLLGRAAMNYTDMCGIENMYSELDEAMSRKLGFKPDSDGRAYVNLRGFFTAPCQHENEIKL